MSRIRITGAPDRFLRQVGIEGIREYEYVRRTEMSNERIGISLVEGVGISTIEGASTAISAIIGNFYKGPLNKATLVTSMGAFERDFGSVPAPGSTGYFSVKGFFKKVGNAPLYIVRVASDTANKGTLSITDGSVNTLRVDALNEGLWGNAISVKTLAYSLMAGAPSADIAVSAVQATLTTTDGLEIGSDIEFDNGTNQEYRRLTNVDHAAKKIYWTTGLTNAYPAATSTVVSLEFSLEVYYNGILKETHNGMSMNEDVSFYVEKILTDENSAYITGHDIKAAKDNDYQDLPTAQGPTALTTGADGLSDVESSDYQGSQAGKTGVYALDEVEGLFRFCCPNPVLTDTDPAVGYKALVQSLMEYADNRVTVTYYSDVPVAQSVTNAIAFADLYASRRLVLFWPWVKVYESKILKTLPPSSLVMACAVEKDYRRGVHKNIGNEAITYGTDLEYYVSPSEGELLNEAGVNTIRFFSGQGFKTYGGRTSSSLTVWRFVHYSEMWNYFGYTLQKALSDIPFEPNDTTTWNSIVRRVTAFLKNEQSKGALYDANNPSGPAYNVLMDSSINPPDQVALGIAKVQIEYVPVGTIEKFIVELTSSPSGLTISS